ncbi:hypothetical protein Trydic_g20195 [Trypoxylus dichotomus]
MEEKQTGGKLDDKEVTVEDSVSVMARDATDSSTLTPTSTTKLAESLHALSTYQIKPKLSDKFKANPVKELIHNILNDTLRGQIYDPKSAKKWTISIANKLNDGVKKLEMKRYKHVVQVTLGENKGAGVKSGVRCLWDAETDGYASDIFINDTIFSVVVVFAIYLY